ncbi:DUF1150 family protein [Martelella alba]|uniref:DUF1150 family protein n=2 Tax=Martelella alba TaxID=2590451 RepID=A0A506UBZ5_9HYPH|nr:DUF1150 family protein [Martelella alba]TPW30179.1 DUF1150 family protein [Martelella alba]
MSLKIADWSHDPEIFAALGNGELCYFRQLGRSEALASFPEAVNLRADATLWGLFAADGTPLLLTENRASIFFKAMEDDIRTVTLH